MGQSTVVHLLNAARDGDDVAREALFERCRNYVSLVARNNIESWLRSKVDASDIVQQTCLSAFGNIQKLLSDNPDEFAAWLRKIHERNVQNALRDQVILLVMLDIGVFFHHLHHQDNVTGWIKVVQRG